MLDGDLNKSWCDICETMLCNPHRLKEHLKTQKHIKNALKLNIKVELFPIRESIENRRRRELKMNKNVCSIPMRNRTGKVVGFTDVDTAIVEKLITYSICLDSIHGYAIISKNGEIQPLHQYIYYTIYGNKKIKDMKVDHFNRKKLDNRIDNLDLVNATVNARNRDKLPNVTSKYWGVCKNNSKNMWVCTVVDDNRIKHEYGYKNELHAAWHYNLLIKELKLKGYNSNDIDEPKDFIKKVKTIIIKKDNDLPIGIFRCGNTFRYEYKRKKFGGFKTPELALADKNKKLLIDQNLKLLKQKEILNTKIKRNKDGIATIDIFNKNKVKVAEILVEDSVYYGLIQSSLSIADTIYVNICINCVSTALGRYLKNCTDPDLRVDHRNGNTFDYTDKNLNVTTVLGNSQNKGSGKNSTSQYVGVNYDKASLKWIAGITYNGKRKVLGAFKTEKEACIARDLRAFDINIDNNNYRINLPREELQPLLFFKALSQENFVMNYLFF